MNDIIKISNEVGIQVNKNAIEPNEYFKIVKENKLDITDLGLQSELQIVFEEIQKAKCLKQKKLVDALEFNIKNIIKERVLLKLGISQYIDRDLVIKYVKGVVPKSSVKIIELERYVRTIPEEPAKKIEYILNKKIFDGILILFTDFTDNDYKTKDDKEFISRNRDPIAFGYFKDEKTGETHSRLYLIASWDDEYCDLTFDKIIKYSKVDVNKTMIDKALLEYVPNKNKPSKFIKRLFPWMKQ